jgi:hypothetical protein
MPPKWQPISTAPKDGTSILIFEAEDGTTGTVRVSRWRDDTIPTGWTGTDRTPSHWLPLPLPPNKATPASSSPVAAEMAEAVAVGLSI